MTLNKFYLTENECYKFGQKHKVKGIMVHSTGCNNPNVATYLNYWNQLRPGGRQVCVHAFLGKLFGDELGTYQTLPWDMVGWHSGEGVNGNANFMGYIGFEICEDDLTDKAYFDKVYREAVELCAYLCKQFGLTEKDIICHSEGHARGDCVQSCRCHVLVSEVREEHGHVPLRCESGTGAEGDHET